MAQRRHGGTSAMLCPGGEEVSGLGRVLALGCSLKELSCHLYSLENDKFAAAACNEFIGSQARSKCWTLASSLPGEG